MQINNAERLFAAPRPRNSGLIVAGVVIGRSCRRIMPAHAWGMVFEGEGGCGNGAGMTPIREKRQRKSGSKKNTSSNTNTACSLLQEFATVIVMHVAGWSNEPNALDSRRDRTRCRSAAHFITQYVVARCDLWATDAGFDTFLGPPDAAGANAAGGPLVIDLIDLLHDIRRQITVLCDGIMMLASGTPARRGNAKYFFRRYTTEFRFQLWARRQHLLEEHDLGRFSGSARHAENDSSFMVPRSTWTQASFIRHGGQILYLVLPSQRKKTASLYACCP